MRGLPFCRSDVLPPCLSVRARAGLRADLRVRFEWLWSGQVDVIEARYNALLEAVTSSRDFESLRAAHSEFLLEATLGCFLRDRALHLALSDLLATAGQFCRLFDPRVVGDSIVQAATVAELKRQFTREACYLHALLVRRSAVTHQGSSVGQLALRLDFNGFFSEAAMLMGQ